MSTVHTAGAERTKSCSQSEFRSASGVLCSIVLRAPQITQCAARPKVKDGSEKQAFTELGVKKQVMPDERTCFYPATQNRASI